jgi:hypothetical protein
MTDNTPTNPTPDDEAVQEELARQMAQVLGAMGSVAIDDPHRSQRVRLRASQLLVWALLGADGEAGMRLAWDTAAKEFGTGIELFGSVIRLVVEYAADHDVLRAHLQAEINRLTGMLDAADGIAP